MLIMATIFMLIAVTDTRIQAQQNGNNNAGGDNTSSETYRHLDLFGDVFERVRAQYVDKVGDEKLIEAAIDGMLTNLDPHSAYLDKDSFKDIKVQTRGEFGGLGIEVTMENGLVKVVSPIDDTPAFRAGIQSGDLITHIDGKPITDMSLSDAVDKMRGEVGTKIEITIRRKGVSEPITKTIKRDVIEIQSVKHRKEGNIGYIRITTFNQNTESGLKSAIKTFRDDLGEDLKGYVIDLRNNPGGLLEQAVAVSDIFLDKGEIVSTRGRDPEDTKRDNATAGDMANGKPIVVLINGGSASASEIVAGALQDHRRAIVMGTKSFGKGSVQTVIPLPGHGAMRLTTARYYTPSGRSIQAKGIKPDIIVEPARVEEIDVSMRTREADLRGALDNGETKKETPNSGDANESRSDSSKEAKDNGSNRDYQLSRALDLLRGLTLYKDRFSGLVPANDDQKTNAGDEKKAK
jgi:carboxyl-terminal processing protease